MTSVRNLKIKRKPDRCDVKYYDIISTQQPHVRKFITIIVVGYLSLGSFQYMIEFQFYENWVHVIVMRNRKILSRHQKKIYNGMHTTKTTRRYNLVKEKLEHIKTKNKDIDTPWIRYELLSWTLLLTSLVNFFRDFLSNFYCCASNDIFPLTVVKSHQNKSNEREPAFCILQI